MSMRKNAIAPIAAGILIAVAGTAGADTKTTTMTVSTSVAGNCNVSTANLNFGSYDASVALLGSANVSVRCSNGTAYNLKLGTGGGSFAQRLLTDGTNNLEYNLYTTSVRSTVWGDGTSSTGFMSGTGTGMSSSQVKTHTVFGELPNSAANQDVPTGAYTDNVIVTVEY
jgi:spore coat protein U-like protein